MSSSRIIFPDLKGSSVFTAGKFLEHHGFRKIRYKYSESSFERNTVLEQNIEPDDYITRETEVVLTLSAVNPIKYLPSIYQTTDDKNGGFLRRYMWIFHSLLNSTNITLDNIHLYFNPMESPKEFFPWIVSWFSDYHEYDIPEKTLRLLIKNIVPLYQWRGTAAGIIKLLEIVTGVKPEIREYYRPMKEYIIEKDGAVENRIMQEETSDSYFTVIFPVSVASFTPSQVLLINDILKKEKPAHTVYYLSFAEDKSELPRDFAIIGVDSIV